MTPSQRLVARLRAMGFDLPEDTVVRRTYAGPAQRAAGAWSWSLWSDTDFSVSFIGSHAPVSELLRVPRLCASRGNGIGHNSPQDTTVYPWSPPTRDDRDWREEPAA